MQLSMNHHRLIYSILIFYLTANEQVFGTSDEDKFFEMYGKDSKTAGVWKTLRKERMDEAGYMMKICMQAHQKLKLSIPNVQASGFDTRTLRFSEGKYEDISLDLVKYRVSSEDRYRYITKGLGPDCVYYLEALDKRGREFQLTSHHICGINM